MSHILDDLDFFTECIDKGQWFMIWKQNWATLFEHRPEWIKYFPKDLWEEEQWRAAVKVFPELAAECPFELKEDGSINDVKVFAWDSAGKDEKVEYVITHPEYYERLCQEEELEVFDRFQIFDAHPVLAENYDWSNIQYWSIHHCNRGMIGFYWSFLLRSNPQFTQYCPCLQDLEPDVQGVILQYKPELLDANTVKWNDFYSEDWKNLLLCLTHCHADHISGLPGLLLTMGNESRTKPMTIIGPQGIKAAINGLLAIAPIVFELDIHELSPEELESWQTPFTVGNMQIIPFPVDHDFPCAGYRVEIPRIGKFNPVKAKNNNVPLPLWSKLQKNQQVEFNGVLYTQDMILDAPRKGIKVVYATDSRPVPRIAEEAQYADLLICEGMYGDPAKYPRAIEAHHMLFSEAATLAQKAQVKRLLLTHFSPGLDNPEEYIQYAQEIFPNACCAVDGMKEVIAFEED